MNLGQLISSVQIKLVLLIEQVQVNDLFIIDYK